MTTETPTTTIVDKVKLALAVVMIGAILVFLDLRRLVERIGPAERRAWQEEWMTPDPADAQSLYQAACFRSLLAAVTLTNPKVPAADAPRLAEAEAVQAMVWLRQAVAAGYDNVTHMDKDRDLDALRGRDDFQQLLAELRQTPADYWPPTKTPPRNCGRTNSPWSWTSS